VGIRALYQVPSTKYKVGIRCLTQIVVFEGTWYIVLGTSYKFLLLDTFLNIECPTPIDE